MAWIRFSKHGLSTLASAAALLAAGCGGGEQPPDTAAKAATEKRAAVTPVDATALMNWAELNFPQFFPSRETNQIFAPYIYRFYPATQNYLGVDGDVIQVLGPISGGVILTVGTVSGFACQVIINDCIAPRIVQSPPNVTVVAGGATTFAADVEGGPSLAYQWQRNGVAIPGATANSYKTSAVTSADNAALIGLQVSNAKGSAASRAATLLVVAAVDNVAAEALASRKGCFGCHGIDRSFSGPAYRDVGARYATVPSPLIGIASSIRTGSRGNWGAMMAPQTNVNAAEATTLATWILSLGGS